MDPDEHDIKSEAPDTLPLEPTDEIMEDVSPEVHASEDLLNLVPATETQNDTDTCDEAAQSLLTDHGSDLNDDGSTAQGPPADHDSDLNGDESTAQDPPTGYDLHLNVDESTTHHTNSQDENEHGSQALCVEDEAGKESSKTEQSPTTDNTALETAISNDDERDNNNLASNVVPSVTLSTLPVESLMVEAGASQNNPVTELDEPSSQDQENIEETFGDLGLVRDTDCDSSAGGDSIQSPTREAAALLSYIEGLSKKLDLERDETPKGLAPGIELHEHQKIALNWLKKQEANPVRRGGILADEMGLGKTIEMIALMVSRPFQKPPPKPFIFHRFDQMDASQLAAATAYNGVECNGTTLIVAPVSLLRQWDQEIRTKTNSLFQPCIFEKKGKLTSSIFFNMPVVLVSYETLARDFDRLQKGKSTVFFDRKALFYRVILDEAHKIKNQKSLMSQACRKLNAEYRWYVSGTPVQNGIAELYPAMSFLKVVNFDTWDHFDKYVLKVPMVDAVKAVHIVLSQYLLRRTKNAIIDDKPILTLPEKVQTYEHAMFDKAQQNAYDALAQEVKIIYGTYKRELNFDNSIRNCLFLRLRQICLHPWLINFSLGDGLHKYFLDEQRLVRNAAYNFTVEQINRILDILKAVKEAGDYFMCEQCGENGVARLIPGCGHGLCCSCFQDISPLLAEVPEPLVLKECPICQTQYEQLFITTLIAFKCAWWPGFRRDSWDEDYLEKAASFNHHSCFMPLVWESESNSGGRTCKRRSVDPRIWGINNVHSIQKYFEDDEQHSEAGLKRKFDDETDSPSAESDTSRNDREPQKRLCGVAEYEAMKESSEGSEMNKSAFEPDIPISGSQEAHTTEAAGQDQQNVEEELFVPQDRPDIEHDTDSVNASSTSHGSVDDSEDNATSTGQSSSFETSSDPADTKLAVPPVIPEFQLRVKNKGEFDLPLNNVKLREQASRGGEAKLRYLARLQQDQLPGCTKITALIALLERKHAEAPEDRIIIFSEFTIMLDFIEVMFSHIGKNDALRYDGSMTADQKDAVVKKFMDTSNDFRILLCSLRSGNVGLNLTLANHVIFMEPYWNPFVEDQAVDRCHRIGQTKPVHVTRIIVPGTIEGRILEVQESKRREVGEIIDNEAAISASSRLNDAQYAFLFGVGELPGGGGSGGGSNGAMKNGGPQINSVV